MTPVKSQLVQSQNEREKDPKRLETKRPALRQPKCRRWKSQICLERERDAAADHAEVIVRTIHHIPAEVVHPADVGG